MQLGEKIFQCRRRLGLSQEELAERVGVTRQAVSKWENGASVPELTTLAALAKVFGVTADYLLSDESAEEQDHPKAAPPLHTSGALGRLIRRWGWLAGIYLAVVGLAFVAVGLASLQMHRSFFTLFNVNGFGFGNPIATFNTLVFSIGGILITVGVILAVVLKIKGRK